MAALARFTCLVRSALRRGVPVRAFSVAAEERVLESDENHYYLMLLHFGIGVVFRFNVHLVFVFATVFIWFLLYLSEEANIDAVGAIPLYLLKLRGYKHEQSAYEEGNLGVIPGSDTLVFRSARMIPYEGYLDNCYRPFVELLDKVLLKDFIETQTLPSGLRMMIDYLKLPKVQDRLVIYSPVFFPKHLVATMLVEAHRLLREELVVRGFKDAAEAIMKQIEAQIPDFMRTCVDHPLLKSYSGAHADKYSKLHRDDFGGLPWDILGNKDLTVKGKKTIEGGVQIIDGDELTQILLKAADSVGIESDRYYQVQEAKSRVMQHANRLMSNRIKLLNLLKQKGMMKEMYIDLEGPNDESAKLKAKDASPVVDTHRHGAMHPIKQDNFYLVKYLPAKNQECLRNRPYKLMDVIDLYESFCSEYLFVTTLQFDGQGKWESLDLRRRFSVPIAYLVLGGEV
uniref:Uncharacterized protein n=1 Tax=Oryza glumipatula TaxID=40148 RepID=A0A0D9ZSG2_9ORYZ